MEGEGSEDLVAFSKAEAGKCEAMVLHAYLESLGESVLDLMIVGT